MKEGSVENVRKIISKYYDIRSIEELNSSISVKVSDLDLNPHDYFDRMVNELDSAGFIAFTSQYDSDDITVIEKPQVKNSSWIKTLLFLAAILSTAYFGYQYQASYSPGTGLFGDIFSGIIFYLLPLSVIFGAREAGKYVALKKNRMSYSFPIFVPDPIGLGTMGLINSPNKPYTSRKAMIEAGSYSLIFGLVISVVFYIFGSLLTFYFPPASAAVNSPVEKIGSPIILQMISINMVPSNGILDPLALAGWAGILTTAFNALPLGFMDGGLISTAILGRRGVYLSYISVIVILALGIIYPPWIVLAVFALLVGVRGPQPLNNRFRLHLNSKVLSAIAFIIVIIGIAPFPFQTSINSFNVSLSQYNFVTYEQNGTINIGVNITNTGSSTLVPAFEIGPAVSFTLSGRSKSIAPGDTVHYTLGMNTSGSLKYGYNYFTVSVYSGSVVKNLHITVLSVNLTPAFSFNNQNPLYIQENESQIFSIYLNISKFSNITVVSIVNPQLNYTYFISPQAQAGIKTINQSMATIQPYSSLSLKPGSSSQLIFSMPHIPQSWTIVAYNSSYYAAVAYIAVVK